MIRPTQAHGLLGNTLQAVTGINLWRLILSVTLIINIISFLKIIEIAYWGDLFSQSLGHIILFILAASINLTGVIVEILLGSRTWNSVPGSRFSRQLKPILKQLRELKQVNLIIFGLMIVVYLLLVFWIDLGVYEVYLDNYPFRLFSFWVLTLVGSVLIKSSGLARSWGAALVASGFSIVVILKLATFVPEITNYPFSLDWSEASKYYYGSLFLSKWIYGVEVPYPVLHPSQFLMLIPPFLIPDSPIVLHRVWQIFLWIATTFMAAFMLEKRIGSSHRFQRWILITWTCLFLLLMPVYYQLLVPIILVYWGFDKEKPVRSLVIVLLASVWAGISRINWFPYPSLLAATLYFLEEPVGEMDLRKYLSKPLLWVAAGTFAAFVSYFAYMIVSGNPIDYFGTSFTSPLLWYRLLPNPTFPSGILLSLMVVTFPQLIVLKLSIGQLQRQYHPLRLFSIGIIGLILFTGGVIVSVKIGGGNNLHNFDSALITLLTVTSYSLFGTFEREEVRLRKKPTFSWIWLAIVIITPVLFILDTGRVQKLPDETEVESVMTDVQSLVDDTVQEGGEVLLISERQLLTFNEIEQVTLLPVDEKIMLMEMAMANHREYLNEFKSGVRRQKYQLIISDPLSLGYKGSDASFGEENDAWVSHIAEPILCYYEPILTYKEFRLEVLAPRQPDETCS